jgi:alkyl sulfatase BDS1-like metallo-beta-lactamase superfamily hydrolase
MCCGPTRRIPTPRGALWRDPRAWRDATWLLRDLEPETLIGQPTLPLKGKDEIFAHLTSYMDFSNLILNQTRRGMLKGLGPRTWPPSSSSPASSPRLIAR